MSMALIGRSLPGQAPSAFWGHQNASDANSRHEPAPICIGSTLETSDPGGAASSQTAEFR